jgi:hypothetical protein
MRSSHINELKLRQDVPRNNRSVEMNGVTKAARLASSRESSNDRGNWAADPCCYVLGCSGNGIDAMEGKRFYPNASTALISGAGTGI